MFLDLTKYRLEQIACDDDYAIELMDLSSIRKICTSIQENSITKDKNGDSIFYQVITIYTKDEEIRLLFDKEEDREEVLQDLKERITKGRYIY